MSGYLTQLSPEVRRQILDLLTQLGVERGRIDGILGGSSTVDHGSLIGLGDNDHPQYALLTALQDEATLRSNADITLQNNINLKADIAYVDAEIAALVVDLGYDVGTRTVTNSRGTDATLPLAASASPAFAGLVTGAQVGSLETVITGLSNHLSDPVDAHDSSAISYDGSGNSALVQAWLTASELHTAVGQLAGQLYTPDEETTEALIAALNALVIADPDVDGLTNPDLFSSDLIVARHIASGSVTTAKLDAQAVTAAKIAAGTITANEVQAYSLTSNTLATNAIRSDSYIPEVTLAGLGDIAELSYTLTATSGTFTEAVEGCFVTILGAGIGGGDWEVQVVDYISPTQIGIFAPVPTGVTGASWSIPLINGYAFTGSAFDLANGHLSTPGLSVDGVSGDVAVRGDFEARSFSLLDNLGLERAVFKTGVVEDGVSGPTSANNNLTFASSLFTGNEPTNLDHKSVLTWNNATGTLMMQAKNNRVPYTSTVDNSLFLDPSGSASLHSIDRTSFKRSYVSLRPDFADIIVIGANQGTTRVLMYDNRIDFISDGANQPPGSHQGIFNFYGQAHFAGTTDMWITNFANQSTFNANATFNNTVVMSGANQLQFADATTRIYRSGNQLVFDSNGDHAWYVYGSARMSVNQNAIYSWNSGSAALPAFSFGADQDTGMYLFGADRIGFAQAGAWRQVLDNQRLYQNGVSSGEMHIGDWPNNGVYATIGRTAWGCYILFGADGDRTMYIRNDSGVVNMGGGGADKVQINSGGLSTVNGGTLNGHLNGNVTGNTAGTHSGHVAASWGYTTEMVNSSVHSSQAWQVRTMSNGTTAGISMWPTSWGVAPVLRCFKDYGEHIDCGNNPGTGYAPFGALSFVTRSSIKLKKDVKERSVTERKEAKEKFKKAKSKVWDDIDGEMTVQFTDRFKDLDAEWQAKGHKPLNPLDDGRDFFSTEHICDEQWCAGTADNPCGLVRKHKGRRGFVAEELAEWMPEAVHFDANNEAMGIDYSVVTTELVDVVQDLLAEVEELRARIEALESKK